jgi:hypothetical protein
MLRRLIVLAAMISAFFVPVTTASAAAIATPGDAAVLASPACSGTFGHGKIRYGVCFRYNCDSDNCNVLAYLGLLNTATSPRTVTWELKHTYDSFPWYNDDNGRITLAAGEQRTIFSGNPQQTNYCPIRYFEQLRISYDSSGWSNPITANEVLACA